MDNKDETSNWKDILLYIVGVLGALFAIYLIINGAQAAPELFQALTSFGEPEYHISSAFGIVN